MIRPILGAAAAVAFAALPAFAASSDQFEMAVDIDRTALETPDGAAEQYKIVKDQVHERCVDESKSLAFAPNFAVSYCEHRTLTSAVRVIDNPNFTAAHEADIR